MNRSILPILFLVLIPIGITISNLISDPVITYFNIIFYGGDFAFILIFMYALYPILYSTEKFFREHIVKSRINEYRSVKHILYFEFPIMIILLILIYYPRIVREYIGPNLAYPIHEYIGPNLAYPVLASVIWILIVRRKEYQYYFARTYLYESIKKKDSIEKTKFFISSIKYYSRYLQTKIGLEVNIDNVRSKFSNKNIDDQNYIIQSLSQAFKTEDKGKPKEILKEIFDIEVTPINRMGKLKNIFSENGIIVIIIFPALQIINDFLFQ
jgi:hypothetical protein